MAVRQRCGNPNHGVLGALAQLRQPGWMDALAPRGGRRVKVQFFMESLCIDCKRFMLEQLYPTYLELGDLVMDLTVVPYGNARLETTAKQVICQHGPAECDANLYQQCAIHIYPFAYRYLPFIHCLDRVLPMGYNDTLVPRRIFAECARESVMDFQCIAACHDDPELAWKLQQTAAQATPKEHEYVPWVLIDGKHDMDEEKDSLLDTICRAYQSSGGHHAACRQDDTTGKRSWLR